MIKSLNWGILGTANIGKGVIPGIKAARNSKLLAVASRSMDKAISYATKWDIPVTYGSYDALLADPEINAVYIPLPNHLHADWTIKAARAGKHVLCEKPITLTVGEIDNVIKARDDNKVVITEAFMYRHHPQTKKVQELLANNKIGDIKLIQGSFSFFLGKEEDIRWALNYGGGSLWDVGCYPVSFTMMITRKAPVDIFGFCKNAKSGVPLSYSGQMRFDNDLISQFDCSFELPYHTYIKIRGTKGSIIIPEPFKPGPKSNIYLNTGDNQEEIKFNNKELYLGEIEDIENAVLHSNLPLISLEESKMISKTLIDLHSCGK